MLSKRQTESSLPSSEHQITISLTKKQAYALKTLACELGTLEMQGVLVEEDVETILHIADQIEWGHVV